MSREWILDETKFFTLPRVRKLVKSLEKTLEKSIGTRAEPGALRDWMLINLVLGSGLRVQEAVSLKCKDIRLRGNLSGIHVREGKKGRSRFIYINDDLGKKILDYVAWKEHWGEDIKPEAPFFFSSRSKGHYSARAFQKAFKRCLRRADLPLYFSFHCLRHTYGTHLLKSSRYNHRLVQKQLGHARLETTQIYTHVMNKDLRNISSPIEDVL